MRTSAGKGRARKGDEKADGASFGRDADSGRMVIDEEDRPWMAKVREGGVGEGWEMVGWTGRGWPR